MAQEPDNDLPPLTPDDLVKALTGRLSPALLARLEKVVPFDRLPDHALAEVAGRVMQDTLDAPNMPDEQRSAIGEAALQAAKDEGFDPDTGARGLRKAIAEIAGKNGRNAEELATGFKTGVDAVGMKPLRFKDKGPS